MLNTEIIRYEFDGFCLDVIDQKLLKEDKEIPLTKKAFQTLLILVQNSGEIVEKDEIMEKLWTDSFVEEANLTQYVYLLRKALDQKTNGRSYIETLNKLGYRLNAKVNEIAEDEQFQNEELTIASQINHPAEEEQEQKKHLEPQSSSERSNQIAADPLLEKSTYSNNTAHLHPKVSVVLFGLILIFLSLVGYFYVYKNSSVNLDKSTNKTEIKSIAVLPFKAIGKESENKKFGLGMSDAVITRLSKLQQIPVLPTSSVFSYADKTNVNSLTAGNELGVDMILEGTVQRDGDRIRVTVQLVKVSNGKSLWAERFDEKYTNIFDVQDLISFGVAQSIVMNLTEYQRALLAQRPTNNIEAVQAYQFGLYFWNKRSEIDLEKAVEYFIKAVELDPNYAQAYAMLADSYNLLGYSKHADLEGMLKNARLNAEKSLALNTSLPEGYIALAFVQTYEPKGRPKAIKSLEKAIELAPYNSTAHIRYGWLLFLYDKNLKSAVGEMRLAQQYDPLSPASNSALCSILLFQQNFNEAVKFCEKALELAPNNAIARLNLAESYFFVGRNKEAISQANKQVESGVQSNLALANLGLYYAKLGRQAEAKEIVAKLEVEAKNDSYLLLGLTTINYALGNSDKGLIYFSKAIKKKVLNPTLIHYDPVWTDVRNDTRFAKILENYESELKKQSR